MTYVFWALSCLGLLLWVAPCLGWLFARWKPPRLSDLPADGPLPRLSILVPACNEEASIERAMKTLLALDYPDVEIIAVDDRSTDRTGVILDGMAGGRLRVLHVRDLPPGWLGKTHALHVASAEATGEFLLFTDADVSFEPTALRRAVRYAADLDLLSVFADVETGGFLEGVVVGFFSVGFTLATRPWRARDPKSRAHVGIGAFNLVRADAYRRMGGHGALRLEIVDDVKLGQRMKRSGARCDAILSGGSVRVRWVRGVMGFIRGTTKNMFAGFGFSAAGALTAVAAILVMTCWPWVGLAAGPLGPRILCGIALLIMVAAGLATPVGPRAQGLFYAFAGVVFSFSLVRSMLLCYARGGVEWRGTLYRLADLRSRK